MPSLLSRMSIDSGRRPLRNEHRDGLQPDTERRPARTAPAVGQTVDVRRVNQRIPVASDVTVQVDDNEQYVRTNPFAQRRNLKSELGMGSVCEQQDRCNRELTVYSTCQHTSSRRRKCSVSGYGSTHQSYSSSTISNTLSRGSTNSILPNPIFLGVNVELFVSERMRLTRPLGSSWIVRWLMGIGS